MRIVSDGATAQGSPTLHILRTPMPFGSPVPYPHSTDRTASPDVDKATATPGAPHDLQPENKGFPCLPYTLPFELRYLPLWQSGEQSMHMTDLMLCMPCGVEPANVRVVTDMSQGNAQLLQKPVLPWWSCNQDTCLAVIW